jgi:hypothetical protein
VERAVRPVLIVVGLVLVQDLPQMVLIPDQGAVEKLAAASAVDEIFGTHRMGRCAADWS